MQRQLGEGTLYRPWLGVDQAVIKHYAEQQQLSWVDDPSNAQVDFDRNFLRHTVIPSIEQRWPNARQAMARTAELCRDTETLMADLAQIDCQRLSVRQERLGVSMCRAELVALSGARQANIIRHLCIANGITVPAHSHWLQIEDQILATEVQDGNGALVRWRGGACSAYRGRIYLLPGLPEHLNQEVNWDGQSPLVIDSVCRLSLEPGGQLNWDGQPLCIRPRQPGMRSKPAGRGHSQALKKLLQEHQLEPWLRHSVPLVYQQQSLKAVADVWVETGATTDQSGAGMRLVWQPLVDR
ncbi:hypothetical protein GCM10025791_47630 [Halioxenophilus aromaticivorans]|uniref:Lysidine-tRNA(Ile) synthetase C-terminal domain-containing protein n=2 Tax=Halioxenophilus aromaticivorans TaxID=1306992 RepID=A0AAV3U9V8_9ALTE